jgi:hypothetical protein
MDDLNDNGIVPKISVDPTPPSSATSDDSGLGGEYSATIDGRYCLAAATSLHLCIRLGLSTISGSSAQLPTLSTPTQSSIKPTKITGRKLYFHQFQSLILKRLHHTKRNWKVFLSHILLPLLFVAMSMGFTLVRPSQVFQRPWLLTPAMYGQSAMFVK